uniref:LRRCT domain-containing protein n=1 Tax=Steinernema glaseri TaxID=37863 RepID=A0A1I7XYF5_9BILA
MSSPCFADGDVPVSSPSLAPHASFPPAPFCTSCSTAVAARYSQPRISTAMLLLYVTTLLWATAPLAQAFSGTPSRRSPLNPTSCPLECECERSDARVVIFCLRGTLNDSNFVNILHAVPDDTTHLEIRPPHGLRNEFHWNDNINRLQKLRSLRLIDCQIPSMSAMLRLPNLRHMDLSRNRIDRLTLGFFSHLPRLETLDLSFNLLNVVPSSVFTYLRELKSLSVSGNRLTDIPPSLFSRSASVRSLEFDGNLIPVTKINALISTVSDSLERLELNNCYLNDSVRDLRLEKTSRLKQLGLAQNSLHAIPTAVLQKAPSLEVLNLAGNAISSVPPCAFCGTNLTRLSLAHNRLEKDSLNPESFAQVHLTSLDLSFNLFGPSFDSAQLGHAQPTLETLHLSGNGLLKFEESHIHTLERLENLHFAANEIDYIPAALPLRYSQLKFLNLSGNALDSLPDNLPALLPRLESVDLSHNLLSALPISLVNSWISQMDLVYLHGNPWDCRCAIQHLQHQMRQRYRYRIQLSYDRTLCAEPELLKGQPVHRVENINDCAVLFGARYGITQSSEMAILLLLLLAVFLFVSLVTITLYYGRTNRFKGSYVTREHSRTKLSPTSTYGYSPSPSSVIEPLSPSPIPPPPPPPGAPSMYASYD